MTTQSESALRNSISLELKKDGLSQRQSGDWQLRFTVAAIDMDQRITTAPMGTRYQCVLVEISDNEEPVDHKAEERDKWRDLGPTKQAGIRCKEPTFWTFLFEERGYPVNNESDAALAVRHICCISSRSELNKPGNGDARTMWHQLDNAYQAWKVVEHA